MRPVGPPVMTTDEAPGRYEAVIGIEVHSQLRTASKMFCGCSTDYDGAPPNTRVCPVCLGLPGALPTINRRAVEHVLTTGAAIEASAPAATRWDRKNYFYPDLPKGYQISQYDLPLASRGRLTFDTSDGPFSVAITRAHLEEDTAKLVHATDASGRKVSLLDFNRSGAPLMEIVTEPDIRTAEQARRYAEELQLLLRSIGASDADMERGQMRVEANVSLRPRGTEPFGVRVEVKNMNSFRAVERAIAHEIERQAAILEAGGTLVQETRGWSEERGETYRMRIKETSDDYRYFPEPDLPPLHLDEAWLRDVRARSVGAAGRAPRALSRGTRPVRLRRLGPRRRPDHGARVRGDPRSRPRPVAQGGRELRHRAACPPDEVDRPERRRAGRRRPRRRHRRDPGRDPRRDRPETDRAREARRAPRVGRRRRRPCWRTPVRARSATTRPCSATSRRCSRRTRRRSPTTGPASRSIGFLVGQVMKASGGAADAARTTELLRERLKTEG